MPLGVRDVTGAGRAMLLLCAVGITAAGVVITTVGMTVVFVPQDLEFIGWSRDAIAGVADRLVPVIAHDRAGFGVAMAGCMRYARPGRALWQTLAIASAAGFGTAVGVHPAIGYLNAAHLPPAVLACVLFGVGLCLLHWDHRRSSAPNKGF